jgi:hypothetical protein
MISTTIPAALPARYVWHSAVGSTVTCKNIDPSGVSNPAQSKKRPAIGFIVGQTGAVLYQDSAGIVQWIPVATAGVYYPADVAQLLATGSATDASSGSSTGALTPTAIKITLFWAP